jgi:hypothetical protein
LALVTEGGVHRRFALYEVEGAVRADLDTGAAAFTAL